ncbi:MAG: hypothetical protein FJ301_00675 [Planctomycetes bacterium]|nr:hypothetical protein [Planctomycetota bacterium]
MSRHRSGLVLAFVAVTACATPGEDVGVLTDLPPLDGSVFVTGGAFLASEVADGAFGGAEAPREAIAIDAIAAALASSDVFQRLAVDDDPARRARIAERLRAGVVDEDVVTCLQAARLAGHDYLLVIEGLQDVPIETQGTNGRWPVTFATWILLGVGALIPDRTFESRATLRVSLRDLQSGWPLHDPLLVAGPIDLSLLERTDVVGLLLSIIVPPFFVGDDSEAVRVAVRDTVTSRLLWSLSRDLKGVALRQRLRERAPADVMLVPGLSGRRVVVRAAAALGSARLVGAGVEPETAAAFAAALLASVRVDGSGFVYETDLPATTGLAQVLVATVGGAVASATFAPGGRP